ncbi:hypothetical protein LSM04_002076 [Trypanosoma melophagium]|uniref:uncharacterized protein n=1 Tax=Trypanosoma melophagium TaxID=715481 RepID=UPI00351A68CD|nr:hypothetical protein LSM04_002076 [Trypanosoma melophagium]
MLGQHFSPSLFAPRPSQIGRPQTSLQRAARARAPQRTDEERLLIFHRRALLPGPSALSNAPRPTTPRASGAACWRFAGGQKPTAFDRKPAALLRWRRGRFSRLRAVCGAAGRATRVAGGREVPELLQTAREGGNGKQHARGFQGLLLCGASGVKGLWLICFRERAVRARKKGTGLWLFLRWSLGDLFGVRRETASAPKFCVAEGSRRHDLRCQRSAWKV